MTSFQSDNTGSIVEPPVLPVQALDQEIDFSTLKAEPIVEGNPVLDRFWVAIRRLPKYLKLAANLARDNQVPVSSKAALVIGGLYTVSPVDLVPGIIPVAGQLDDLAVLLFSIRAAIRSCPPEVATSHLRRAGLTYEDVDADLDSVRETVMWLAAKGYRASRKFASWGGQRIVGMWKAHVRPVSSR